MKQKGKIQRKSLDTRRQILLGSVISVLLTILTALLVAWLTSMEKIPERSMGYAVLVMLLLASFVGAVIACRNNKHNRIMIALVTGVIYMSMLLSAGVVLFDGNLCGVGETMLLVICGDILSVMWTSRAHRKKKFKIPNC